MIHPSRALLILSLLFLPAALAAQSRSAETGGPSAGTTLAGDTGLWLVAAADVLPSGGVSAGLQHVSEPRESLSRNVTYTGLTLAAGLGGRAEAFGSWQTSTDLGRLRANGDAAAGVKVNLFSEDRGAPVGLALRSLVTLPVGAKEVSGGQADTLAEAVVSRRVGPAELIGSSGFVWRRDAEATSRPNSVRGGLGLAVRAAPSLRVFTELHGQAYEPAMGQARLAGMLDTPTLGTAGAAWQFGPGLTVAGGVNRAFGAETTSRGWGGMVRFGYRPAFRRPVAPAAPVAPAPFPAPVASAAPRWEDASRSGDLMARDPREMVFEDVHFEFDRYTLRPSSLQMLDRAVAVLVRDRAMRLEIEGHTCFLGTNEYNLGLGERRAEAVRAYLVSRGVALSQLSTVSYGEEHPKYDNSMESSRTLNRRAALVVTLIP